VSQAVGQQQPALPALLQSRGEYQKRLDQILPKKIIGTSHGANPSAAATVFVMMYVGAIGNQHPVRPSTITWMSDSVAAVRTLANRLGYYQTAMKSEKALNRHCAAQGIDRGELWYAKDSREPVRDNLYALRDNGALHVQGGVQTTAAHARYVLDPDFAALFDPALTGTALEQAIETWQASHLSTVGKARALRLHQQSKAQGQITVALPGGGTRVLQPGESSAILKGVIEQFAPARLVDPVVVFISQSGEPVNVVDNALLKSLGLPIEQQKLLPDCLLFDLDSSREELWLVEVVHSDGPVTEQRRALFIRWATQHGIKEEQCRFLTAFESRANSRARRALPQLARNSHAWFASEPDGLLTWADLT
jgi:hypothetical protein